MARAFYITRELVAFFANGDFGPSYDEVVLPGGQTQCIEGPPFVESLPLVTQDGVIAHNTANDLLMIYIVRHQLQDTRYRYIHHPNEEMAGYLEPFFDYLEELDRMRPAGGDQRLPFNRQRVRSADISRIITAARIPDNQLDIGDLNHLIDPNTRDESNRERDIVMTTLACLRGL